MAQITIKTGADVEALPVTGERYRAWDAITKGLCVRVGAGGGKAWWYEYRALDGSRQCVKLGTVERLKPGDARKAVKKLGVDPAAVRREEKAAAVAEQQAAEQRAGRTLRTFLTGTYWTDELLHKRSGAATKARILADWAELLDTPLDEIDAFTVERLRRAKLKAGAKPQTVNRSFTALRALLNAAARFGVIDASPIARGGVKNLKVDDDRRVRWLGQRDEHESFRRDDGQKIGERERFLAALDKSPRYLQVLAMLPYYSGLRRGEVFGLTWGAVDFQRDVITVAAHTAKGAKTRHVPMPMLLKGVLLGWKDAQNAARRKDKEPELRSFDFVVPNPQTGRALTTIKRAWTSLMKAARIGGFNYHDLRHDYASRLVMRGTDLYVVRDLLGHSTIQLTERYAHLAPERLRAAVEAL